MPEISIADVLNQKQMTEFLNKTRELRSKGFAPNTIEFTAGLKELFGQWRKELESKGFDSNYLAYLVSYLLSKGERL